MLCVHLGLDVIVYNASLCSNLVNNYRQFSKTIVPMYTPKNSEWEFQSPHPGLYLVLSIFFICNTVIFTYFYFSYSSGDVVVLKCISVLTNKIWVHLSI